MAGDTSPTLQLYAEKIPLGQAHLTTERSSNEEVEPCLWGVGVRSRSDSGVVDVKVDAKA
jgi:hypothetical protein